MTDYVTVLRSQIDTSFERLRALSLGSPPTGPQRRELLESLRTSLMDSRQRIQQAVEADFGKPIVEADLTELTTVLLELHTALNNLNQWMAPRSVPARFPFWTTKSRIVPQPRGVVLVVSPWNYPVLLALAPIVSALAAGNRVILKPSERTPHTSALLGSIIEASVGPNWCVVHEGDAEIGAYLLEKPFDHFFFTGSPEVGRIVARAAAEHWSSVTLELGGKSPVIVDDTVDVEWAASKIIVGKFLNAGQTCIAPDYVVAHEIIYDELLDALVRRAAEISAESRSPMCGVIDERHAEYLKSLWEDARSHGAAKQGGDELDLAKISVVTGVPIGSRLMKEEIFGPILPVLRYQSLEDILGLVNGTGPPLTTYLFTRSDRFAEEVAKRVKTGSICRNDALLHFANPELPFGGVGKSGFGRTHGFSGFRTFSNEVSVLEERWSRGIVSLLFPERGPREVSLREWLIRFLNR